MEMEELMKKIKKKIKDEKNDFVDLVDYEKEVEEITRNKLKEIFSNEEEIELDTEIEEIYKEIFSNLEEMIREFLYKEISKFLSDKYFEFYSDYNDKFEYYLEVEIFNKDRDIIFSDKVAVIYSDIVNRNKKHYVIATFKYLKELLEKIRDTIVEIEVSDDHKIIKVNNKITGKSVTLEHKGEETIEEWEDVIRIFYDIYETRDGKFRVVYRVYEDDAAMSTQSITIFKNGERKTFNVRWWNEDREIERFKAYFYLTS